MEGGLKNGEACPQVLDFIPRERSWLVKRADERSTEEEKKLELRLGPPGEEWSLGKTAKTHMIEKGTSFFSLLESNKPISSLHLKTLKQVLCGLINNYCSRQRLLLHFSSFHFSGIGNKSDAH